MKNQVIELLKSIQHDVMNIEKPNKFGYQISFSQEDVSKLLGNLIMDISEMEEKNTNIDLESLRNELDTEIVHIISYHDYDENITLDIDRDRTIEVSFDENYLEREVKRKIEEIFSNLEEEMENKETENVVGE
jgi:Fe2+ transport system protein B